MKWFLNWLLGRRLVIWKLTRSKIWIKGKKMPSIKIGQFYDASVAASDGSAVTGLSVVSDTGAVSVGAPDASNVVRITASSEGTANVTWSAPGFNPASEVVVVAARPNLVVTDGPVQG